MERWLAREARFHDSKLPLPPCARMNVSEPFIRRPVGTSLLAAGLFLAGTVAYHFLPVAPLPRVDFPMINVFAGLPGALMARRCARPAKS